MKYLMKGMQMKLLKIKDNQYTLKSEFHEVSSIVSRVCDKTLAQLEQEGVFVFPNMLKDTEDLSRDQMILKSCNQHYVSGNVMGFLGAGEERLVIESRFSKGENDFFFQYLLEKVLNFPDFINLQTSANQEEQMFLLLMFLFPKYLSEAMRKGIFKTYIQKQYNDGNVRGTIDVARHIRKNIPFTGKIAYHQREYSYDNSLTELVRHTIEYIRSKAIGHKLLHGIKDAVAQIVDATPGYKAADRRKIIEANRKNAVRHAYFHEYSVLQQLCILILQDQEQQFGIGNHKVYGILFDGAWLWEEYVNTLIEERFYHPKNKAGVGVQRLFAGGIGKIYPDFIGRDPENRIIADAKYKPINNIRNEDYFQVLAYMLRFDAKKGYYLYPEANGIESKKLFLNQGSTYEENVSERKDICVIKYGLHIPENAVDYNDFVDKLKQREKEFMCFR